MRSSTFLGLVCGLALATSMALAGQPPVPSGKAPPVALNPYPPTIYQFNDVGKSLNLTADQIARLNKITEQTQTTYRDDYGKLGTLTDAERFARAQELNQRYYSDWNKNARDVFNDTQRARYQQLGYQYGGFNTFYDPATQKQLNLTADQIKNLRDQYDWSAQQLAEINRTGATDATKGAQMYRDYWTARQERMNKFLTPEQQKAWGTLVGDPYTFQPVFVPPR